MAVGRIVTSTYRYKRPPRKRKAVALEVSVIVTERGKTDAVPPQLVEDHPTPANDARKPAIATSISRKRTRLLSAAQASAPDDLEADTAMRAWLERAKWGGPVR
jgi:hypothetical protein